METKVKKKKLNLIMIALIAIIVFCGIMAVGSIKGWFGNDSSPMVIEDMTGTANIERSGVGYSLEKGTSIKAGDIIETGTGSQTEISVNKTNSLGLNENTELAVGECREDNITLNLEQGELFADIPKAPDNFEVSFGENAAKVTGTVFSVSAQHGSASLNVYEGTVEVTAEDGSNNTVESGQSISIAHNGNGELTVEVNKLELSSLSNFIIDKLQSSGNDELCFTQKAIKKVIKDRNEEKSQAADSKSDVITANSEGSSTNSGTSSGNPSSGTKDDKTVSECTITIRCDTILKNMDNLSPGKDKYVPANGVILAASTVEFKEGDTVFDVLKRACSYAGIPLEYSYTPLYESYYIEGINNLYEFDCGEQSGWMYKVNGWFPNYGCSSYKLKDGDNIVWTYTCNGLGADVGGNVY